MSVALSACSGEKFTSDGQHGSQSDTPTVSASAGTSHRNQAGSTGSYGGSGSFGASGQATSSGMSSDGGAADTGSASGGTSSSAGASSSGGSGSGDACPSGSVTFRMLPSLDLSHDYLCDAGCGTGWLTITDADGAMAYSLFSACGTASCDTCEVQPCAAAACLPMPLTATGSELVWTGTVLAKGTCGANMTCQKADCVKPGTYRAKACAAINAGSSNNGTGPGCTPKNEQLCAEATFDFPSTQTVKLILKKL